MLAKPKGGQTRQNGRLSCTRHMLGVAPQAWNDYLEPKNDPKKVRRHFGYFLLFSVYFWKAPPFFGQFVPKPNKKKSILYSTSIVQGLGTLTFIVFHDCTHEKGTLRLRAIFWSPRGATSQTTLKMFYNTSPSELAKFQL